MSSYQADASSGTGKGNTDSFAHFVLFFIVASIIELVSHTVKELTVRSQPVDQDSFTFKVSLS
jgi:hypothetical protein